MTETSKKEIQQICDRQTPIINGLDILTAITSDAVVEATLRELSGRARQVRDQLAALAAKDLSKFSTLDAALAEAFQEAQGGYAVFVLLDENRYIVAREDDPELPVVAVIRNLTPEGESLL